MPIYEFKCEVCNELEEVIQSVNDNPPIHCKKPMKKLISGTFNRKGGGLYSVDFVGDKTSKLGDLK